MINDKLIMKCKNQITQYNSKIPKYDLIQILSFSIEMFLSQIVHLARREYEESSTKSVQGNVFWLEFSWCCLFTFSGFCSRRIPL